MYLKDDLLGLGNGNTAMFQMGAGGQTFLLAEVNEDITLY